MQIERISKTYYSSSNKESIAVVIPKAIRDVMNITAGNYVKWKCTVTKDGTLLTIQKVE